MFLRAFCGRLVSKPEPVSFTKLLHFCTYHTSHMMSSPLKRKAGTLPSPSPKKPKIIVPDYHLTPSRRDENGEILWPAPKHQIQRARDVILECANSQKPTLLLPDKDADGLSSGAILHHTLTALGLDPSLISVYFPPKGSNVHDAITKEGIASTSSTPPEYIFVLDQGSRQSPPLIDTPHTCLVIDHHFAREGSFPEGAEYVTAHDCPPVATSALLTHHICSPLHDSVAAKLSWLAVLGTHGDLGNTIKWQPPFPDMSPVFQAFSKKAFNDAVALINAPRRSAAYNVPDAWTVLLTATGPNGIVKGAGSDKLRDAQAEVARETNRCTHTPPIFSRDATIAVLTISSAAQVHPVIATRWAGTLASKKLEVVMCANEGYMPGKVHFSCRIAKCARARVGADKVDIIAVLEGLVEDKPELRVRLGESFARGHREASGGVVGVDEWKELRSVMGLGEGGRKNADGKGKGEGQKNTIANYFKKP